MIAGRSVLAVLFMMIGAAIFGGDPSRFGGLGIGGIPGYIVCGMALFTIGLLLRIKTIVRNSDRGQVIDSNTSKGGREFVRLNC